MTLRPARPDDLPRILALNEESVHFLSPLDPARLRRLHDEAAYHRVFDEGAGVGAFLLALREGSSYDSPNYRWFAERHPQFLYVDRVVVSPALRGRGVGKCFYADLFAFARASGIGMVTCEFDLEPPNPASREFHRSLGFTEVGTQVVGPGRKRVSLQVRAIDAKAEGEST